ncbi:MAG: hypothetical protein IH864_02810 [Chloroflexi bacterium]|nr:hypothetical protein [Chloroflexota bacterium]
MATQRRNKRALLKPLALLGLVAALLFVFAGQEAMAQDSTVVVPRRQPIQIAVVVDLPGGEGPLELIGQGAVNAVQMAIEDHGDIQGFSVQQNNFDGECDSTAGEAAAKAVVRNPKNVGVIGHLCSGSYRGGLPIYESAGVVTISGSATAPTSFLSPLGPTVFNRTVIAEVFPPGPDPVFDEWMGTVETLPTVITWQADYQLRFPGELPEFAEFLPFFYDATRLLLTRIDEVASMHRGGNLVIDRD